MITLNSPTTLVTQPAVSSTVPSVDIVLLMDSPIDKTVTAMIKYNNGAVANALLWSGASYDAINQWTDSDVTARIQAMAAAHLAPFA